MKNIILCNLYKLPTKKRIQRDIFDELKIHLHTVQLYMYRKQLVAEGLIEEIDEKEEDCEVKITVKGYEAIQLYGSYKAYCIEKQKQTMSERNLQYLKETNLRLVNLNILVGIVTFILGVLLSDPLKNLLRQWMSSD